MKEVAVPPGAAPPLHRSGAACIAAILETEADEVPVPEAGHPDPWTVWRNWLGTRGLGLVPVREPAAFWWPGPWIALMPGDGEPVAAVAFGSPPGIAWRPLGGSEDFAAVEDGYALAPADVALWEPRPAASASAAGHVEALAIAPSAEALMRRVEEVRAEAGRGLEGDRYFEGRGTFSRPHARGIDITLVEAEALEQISGEVGELAPEQARRNVITRGIDLNALVGRRFSVGEVECLGQRLCEPCAHLERLTRPGVLRASVHRGGLRADVVVGGTVRVGDEVRVSGN